MKYRLSLLTLFIAFLSISVSTAQQRPADRGYKVKVGDKLENIDFDLIDGTKTSLEELKGKVVVLQFTASWCVVCRKEMPHLESEVWQPLKDKDFVLIGVDLKEPLDKVKTFIEKMGTTYPISLDPDGSIFHTVAKERAGVTRNVVLDRDGNIIFLTRLFDRAEFDEMIEVIKAELDKA